MTEQNKQDEAVARTPAATWRANGEPDPHGDYYDRERATLPMGKLTDDELANGAFMNYDHRPSLEDLLAGKRFMPIVWMTAVKDRIRWLSRALVKAQAASAALAQEPQGEAVPIGYINPEDLAKPITAVALRRARNSMCGISMPVYAAPPQAASVASDVSRWMRVDGDYLYISRCNWIYPNATEDHAGERDERRYAAVDHCDGDMVLSFNGAYGDAKDLATMLSWPVAAAPKCFKCGHAEHSDSCVNVAPGAGAQQAEPATPLWMIHIEGPDDLVAAPTKKEAERIATAINAVHGNWATKRRAEIAASGGNPDHYPTTRAVVVPFDGPAQDHAASLAADWDGYVEYVEARAILAQAAPSASAAKCFKCGHPAHSDSCVNVAPSASAQAEKLPVELRAVAETVAKGDGFWRPCTGCYDTEDGRPTQKYAHSDVFGCELGNGCGECGGLGAVWDDTDYAEMAEFVMKDDVTPAPSASVQQAEPVANHCEHGSLCKWQGAQGWLAWGKPETRMSEWRKWHDEKCGGRILPLYAVPAPSVSPAAHIRPAYCHCVNCSSERAASPADQVEDARDAARYRWMRDNRNSLEAYQRDKGIHNGTSCYQVVGGVRELKSTRELDEAIDAAMSATPPEGGA
ncbi:hypothetical protein [Cupriavidus sp. DF5525]|uniref:hypothetical protein n=1 Tax=Cupriavidus sp. DF5525 TaxID=3160989 RepID=UPI0032DF6D87